MMYTSLLGVLGLLVAETLAHGAVTSYRIAGTTYPGYQGFSPSNTPNVIQWQWPDYNPVLSCSSAQLRCNNGRSATLSAPAAPGDSVTAIWQQWTHSQGPILVWMYKCSGAFSSCTGDGAGWFKIAEAGFSGDGTSVFLDTENPSGWAIAKLNGGGEFTTTIPQGLAPGNYLIRHELIALHQANAPQFYPECAQIVVSGSGTSEPSSSQKASIPGYCSDSDSNIRVPINDHSIPQTYKIPGPAVFRGTGSKKARDFSA